MHNGKFVIFVSDKFRDIYLIDSKDRESISTPPFGINPYFLLLFHSEHSNISMERLIYRQNARNVNILISHQKSVIVDRSHAAGEDNSDAQEAAWNFNN